MAELSLALLKKQVRADDFTEDDEYLSHLLETARETVASYANRDEDEIGSLGCTNMFTQAVLMLAAHWYNQRESVASVQMHQVPDSVSALVKRFTKLVDSTDED